jgi:hypothetical protein
VTRHESFTVFAGENVVSGVSVDLTTAQVIRKVGDVFASGVVQTRARVARNFCGAIVSSEPWKTLANCVKPGDSGFVNPDAGFSRSSLLHDFLVDATGRTFIVARICGAREKVLAKFASVVRSTSAFRLVPDQSSLV